MRTLFERISANASKVNVAVNYNKKDGTAVAAHQTQYDVLITGRVQGVTTQMTPTGKKRTVVSLKPDTYIDPIFGVEVTDPGATYVAFYDTQYAANATKVEEMKSQGRLNENALIIVKAIKIVQTDDLDGSEKVSYTGKTIYKTNRIAEVRDNASGVGCWVMTGPAVLKDDGSISIPLTGYNSSKKNTPEANYTYWVKLTPDGGALTDEQKADFSKIPGLDGKFKNHRVMFVINHDKYTPKVESGLITSGEAVFSSYIVL